MTLSQPPVLIADVPSRTAAKHRPSPGVHWSGLLLFLPWMVIHIGGCVTNGNGLDDDAADDDTTDDCPSGELGFGTDLGDCAVDFSLEDKDGVTWTLHEQAGQVVLLDISAFW